MKRIFLSSVLALSMMGAMPGTAQPIPDEPGGGALHENRRISLLLNRKVLDADGKTIGKIEDVLINQKGEIQHLIVGSGGFWGLGGTDFQLPWKNLEPDLTEMGFKAVLPQSKDLPGISLTTMNDPETSLWKLSSLIGMTASIDGKPSYGEVDELLFDPKSGRITYFVLERNGWAADRYAVPWVGESMLNIVREGALFLPFSETEILSPGIQVLPANDGAETGYVMNLWL